MAVFPGSIKVFPTKSEARDSVEPEFDSTKFINGFDVNDMNAEIMAIMIQLGAYQKFEFSGIGPDLIVGSGSVFLDGARVDFPGGSITLSGDASVWVNTGGELDQGVVFPGETHCPIAEAGFSGGIITGTEDVRVWIAGQNKLDATKVGFDVDDPTDWDPEVPSDLDVAVNQIGDRLTDLERVVPTVPTDSEFFIEPVYPESVYDAFSHSGIPDGIISGFEAPTHTAFIHVAQAASGTGAVKIQMRHRLPTRMVSLDGVSILAYRSGTISEMSLTLFKEDGTLDVGGIDSVDVTPSVPSVYEDSGFLVPSGTYDPGEKVILEIRCVLDDPGKIVRWGKVGFKMDQT